MLTQIQRHRTGYGARLDVAEEPHMSSASDHILYESAIQPPTPPIIGLHMNQLGWNDP